MTPKPRKKRTTRSRKNGEYRDVHIWLSVDQYEQIEKAALADNRSVSNMVETIVMRYLPVKP